MTETFFFVLAIAWIEAPLLLAAGFAKCAPLAWAALGGLLSERSGIINIGLEGMMLIGAFFAVLGVGLTGSPWAGVGCALLSGAVTGLLHAVLCIHGRTDQIISGMGINLIALGLTGMLLSRIFDAYGNSPTVEKLPVFSETLALSPLHLCLLLVLAGIILLIYYTRTGLNLRACGEDPGVVRSAGIWVNGYRYAAVTLGGALAGIGGAQLSISDVSQFTTGMTNGRGFIALAALICSGWRPGRALLICWLFGMAEAGAERLQTPFPEIPSRAMLALPFAVALIVLALRPQQTRPPAALGKQ